MHPFEPLSPQKSCPICQENSVAYFSSYPSEVEPFASTVVEYCTHCGSGYVPGAGALLDGYYETEYSRSNRRDRMMEPNLYFSEATREKSPKLSRYFKRGTRQLDLLRDLGNPVERLLDFGSGPGYLLYLSNAKEIAAFEPDKDSEKYLSHINATQYVALQDLPRDHFDAVVSSHSMEHLPVGDLIATLRVLLAALKPDGHLLIEVPQGGLSHLKLSSRHDPHTIFFTNEGLQVAVKAAGGDIVFSKCFSPKKAKRRPDAIYTPEGTDFIRYPGGALTVVVRRGAHFVAPAPQSSAPAGAQTTAQQPIIGSVLRKLGTKLPQPMRRLAGKIARRLGLLH